MAAARQVGGPRRRGFGLPSFGFRRPSLAQVFSEARRVRGHIGEMQKSLGERGLSREEREYYAAMKESKEQQEMMEFESTMKLSSKEKIQQSQKAMMQEAREKMQFILKQLKMKGSSRMAAMLEQELIRKLGLEVVSQVDAMQLVEVFSKSRNLNYVIGELNNGRKVNPKVMDLAVMEIRETLEEASGGE